MADINFDCPYCKQNLDAPDDLVGTNIECPTCGKLIRVVMTGKENMDATTRIELPAEYLTPERKNRVIFIKRPGR